MCTLYRFGDTLKLLGLGRLDTRRLVLIFGFPANARTINQLDELIGFGVYRKFHTGSSFTRILHKLSDNRQLVSDLKGTIFFSLRTLGYFEKSVNLLEEKQVKQTRRITAKRFLSMNYLFAGLFLPT